MITKNKVYYWFKLKEDFFKSKELKLIRKLPSGAEIIIVLLQMQLLALSKGGIIEIDNICDTVEEELSILIDEDEKIIKLALITLEKFSLIQAIDGGDIKMLLHDDLVGKETASTIRSRQSRALKASKKGTNLIECCNATTMQQNCSTELELEIELDNRLLLLERDKNATTEKKEILNSSSPIFFLNKDEYKKINAATRENIIKKLPQLQEQQFKNIYNLTELECAMGLAKDFNAVLFKGLLGTWTYRAEVKKTPTPFFQTSVKNNNIFDKEVEDFKNKILMQIELDSSVGFGWKNGLRFDLNKLNSISEINEFLKKYKLKY